MRRRIKDADEHELRKVGDGDIGPALAVVLGNMNVAVVRADPENTGFHRRFRERKNRRIPFGTVSFASNGSPITPGLGVEIGRRLFECFGIRPAQIRADDLPALTFVRCLVHELRRHVENVRIVRRRGDRISPPETVVDIGRAPAVMCLGIGRDVPDLPGAVIVPIDPRMFPARREASISRSRNTAR